MREEGEGQGREGEGEGEGEGEQRASVATGTRYTADLDNSRARPWKGTFGGERRGGPKTSSSVFSEANSMRFALAHSSTTQREEVMRA